LARVPIANPSGWLSILNKLGIPRFGAWQLDDVVIPVALVDSEITLNAAVATPLVNVPASGGELVAPAANTRLATTGPLPAGPYSIVFWIGVPEGNYIRIRRRNAADTADVWAHRFWMGSANGQPFGALALRLVLALNEFVVVENVVVGGAGLVYQASLFVNAG
jgi:hypothetical protein